MNNTRSNLVNVKRATQHHIPEDSILHNYIGYTDIYKFHHHMAKDAWVHPVASEAEFNTTNNKLV
jgi:hypothetical protein